MSERGTCMASHLALPLHFFRAELCCINIPPPHTHTRFSCACSDITDLLTRVPFQAGQVKVWLRPIIPRGSFAIVLLYTNVSGGPSKVTFKLQDVGMTTAAAYNFTEVYSGTHIGFYKPWHTFNCEVNPTGVLFIQATVVP